jgi:hypothetical protein
MSERVAILVAEFKHLPNMEQAQAYLEIDTYWKALAIKEVVSRRLQARLPRRDH